MTTLASEPSPIELTLAARVELAVARSAKVTLDTDRESYLLDLAASRRGVDEMLEVNVRRRVSLRRDGHASRPDAELRLAMLPKAARIQATSRIAFLLAAIAAILGLLCVMYQVWLDTAAGYPSAPSPLALAMSVTGVVTFLTVSVYLKGMSLRLGVALSLPEAEIEVLDRTHRRFFARGRSDAKQHRLL